MENMATVDGGRRDREGKSQGFLTIHWFSVHPHLLQFFPPSFIDIFKASVVVNTQHVVVNNFCHSEHLCRLCTCRRRIRFPPLPSSFAFSSQMR